jgi:hypothetical protein
MRTTKTPSKRGKDLVSVRAPKVVVGDAFTDDDIRLANDPKHLEYRARALTTVILLAALILFFAVYVAHEWWVGASFDPIGRFVEGALLMLLGWALGKNSHGGQP